VEHNLTVFATRAEKDGIEPTRLAFGRHVWDEVERIHNEGTMMGACTAEATIEATIALTTACILDLVSKHATFKLHADSTFSIYLEGIPWLDGDTEGLKS
jgi:hypothetical protein